MDRNQLNKLNKTDLWQKIEDYGLTGMFEGKEMEDVTKAVIIDAIMEYIDTVKEEDNKKEETKQATKGGVDLLKKYGVNHVRKLPRHVRADLQRKDLLRKECVVVHDLKTNQTTMPVIHVSWGNELIGFHTDNVILNGSVGQYVHRGAIKNLEQVTYTVTDEQKGKRMSGEVASAMAVRTIKRFQVIRVEGLDEQQIAKLKIEQIQKKSLERDTL